MSEEQDGDRIKENSPSLLCCLTMPSMLKDVARLEGEYPFKKPDSVGLAAWVARKPSTHKDLTVG